MHWGSATLLEDTWVMMVMMVVMMVVVMAMRDHDAREGPGYHIGNLCRFSLNDFHLCRKGTQVDM